MAAPAPSRPSHILFNQLCHFLALLLCATVLHGAPKWEPISKEELADNKPHVDPEAGAEILYHEVVMDHTTWHGTRSNHYVRAKIYSTQGCHYFSRVELRYDSLSEINDIYVRTIKPDGTIVEIQPKDIYEREMVKGSGFRVIRAKSFAPPAIELGAIVEYRYTEVTPVRVFHYLSLNFQSDLPTRLARFKLRPFVNQYATSSIYHIRAMSVNCPDKPINRDKYGFYTFEMTDLKAIQEEPFQPPFTNISSTTLVYYTLEKNDRPQKEYWGEAGKELAKNLEKEATPTKAIRTALAGIVSTNDSESNKLRKIYDYCRTKIINRRSDASGLTHKQLEKLTPNESPSDVLKAGNGTGAEINALFAALARAAGFEVHSVACNDRSKIIFNPDSTETGFMLRDYVVAVCLDGNWQYFDPGSIYLPFGMLSWKNTDTTGLISESDGKAQLTQLKGEPAEASVMSRKAKLNLLADGSLEGDVTQTFTGLLEVSLKGFLDAKTTLDRDKFIKEALQENQKLAELTNIVIENAASPLDPLKISYHLRIPDFAAVTGTRLFFQPAIFQKGAAPWFDSEKRNTSIVFDHRYTTEDEIRIAPPDGYVLEEAAAPGDLDLGPLGSYKTSVGVGRKTGMIIYQRTFKLADLIFPKTAYPQIKAAFDTIHKNDNHTLTLKLKEPDAKPAEIGASGLSNKRD